MKRYCLAGSGMLAVLTVIYLSLVFPLLCHSAVVSLPRTGQTVCTDAAGAPINCSGTGQDGERQSGVAWPSPRFTIGTGPEAACVTDNLTGLMWVRDGHRSITTRTWQEALSYVDIMNLLGGDCGHSDWRLPNINELESLYNADSTLNSTWLASQGFSNIERYYWSSTTYANDSTLAWLADLHYGHIQTCKKVGTGGCKTYVMQVRTATAGTALLWETGQTKCYSEAGAEISCAGTGQDGEKLAGAAWPATRFSDNGNGTVTDNLTGVIWLQDADCFGLRTWPEALSDAAALSSGQCGLTDGSAAGEWRLPNRKEQFSLTDRSLPTPALSAGHPFLDVVAYIYWASTSFAQDATFAWYWSPGGTTSSYPKTTTGYVWPVYDSRKELTTAVSTGGGAGTGTVMPSCEAGCWYAKGQQVAITAIPDHSSILSCWLGDCT